MRKLFFFRSSASSSGNSNPAPPTPNSEKVFWETPWENGVNNASDKGSAPSGLRRSLSFSSADIYVGGVGERNLTHSTDPSKAPTSRNILPQVSDFPVRCRSRTPVKQQSKAKSGGDGDTIRKAYGVGKNDSPNSSRFYHESSGNSSCSSDPVPFKCGSTCLNHASNKILDLYIDSEQQQDRNLKTKNGLYERNLTCNGNGGNRLPPRVQASASPSPTDSKLNGRSYSFGEMRETKIRHSTRERKKNDLGTVTPQKNAKDVIERLCKLAPQKPKTTFWGLNTNTPTPVGEIFDDYSDVHLHPNSVGVALKSCISDGPYGSMNGFHMEESSGIQKHKCFHGNDPGVLLAMQTEGNINDMELHRKAKEAAERALLFAEEVENETLLQDGSFSVSAMFQKIKILTQERRNLALEVSAQLQSRITDRSSANEALKASKVEMDCQIQQLEKEKKELQLKLDRELDRRSRDWSFKLEKYQSEEQRLRERVSELAEQNVSLQREVSALNGRDMERKSWITDSELQLKELMARVDEARGENQELKQTMLELQDRVQAAEADSECIQRSYKEKEKENKDLQKAITRLQRTCSEQEKTIGGLRQALVEEIEKKQSSEKLDNHFGKLQMEQVRLAGVEQSLRREVESYRVEVESLRHENINLLDRLRGTGNDGGSLYFKVDQELLCRVECLQKQGLSLLNECSQLCVKLLDFIKGKPGKTMEAASADTEQCHVSKSGLDVYFVVESDMKVQSFKRAIENMRKSLQMMDVVLHEKSNPMSFESQSQCKEGGGFGNCWANEDDIEFKLKAETLLTSVLREKLYSKELEIELLQAEVATVVRGHDILRCEVQSAQDALSCVTHKMNGLDLQMLRKDESINQLKCDLQERTKELTIIKGIFPKVSEERDLMWEQVKQYSEKNMLLNSEINFLKKKIEALDEDILLKEGQITILKDSLGSKSFDLYSPNSMKEFAIE
ncbi:myosin-13-like [Macadamia integrifolia]|uniref:myosin-13-like n=1 Tax=Macadamia integrifolia TaxID=60698 RepID=UPI001C4E675E|nr:myosin-13-like [Macadamia integrifolia]XP_042513121.1 myosin-13-like [Macadamia integrifolia]XP_042513122.1 myosin-13-like [Macadamia integrifolia]XP_042513123.1 myosin-13-like [Macadamia integrifolia]